MSSRWGRHGPGTARGDPHASRAHVLLDADSSRKVTRNEGVSACGMKHRTLGYSSALYPHHSLFIWLDLLQLNVHREYPHHVPESAPRNS